MKRWKISIEPRALIELQEAVDWYNEQQKGLGKRFNRSIRQHFSTLKSHPKFQIRYDAVRCLPVKNFPYMIHYRLDEINFIVNVFAIIHTSRNPDKSWLKK